MKVKVSEATNLQLDWMVARCEGYEYGIESGLLYKHKEPHFFKRYSTDWSQGGPIIERENILLDALPDNGHRAYRRELGAVVNIMDCWGATKLMTAMRCYVASHLGDEVDVPEGLS